MPAASRARRASVAAAAAFVAVDLAYLGAASRGRDRFLEVTATCFPVWVVASALATFALLVHVGYAVRASRAGVVAWPDADTRRLQLAAGLAMVPMFALHVLRGPLGCFVLGRDAFGAYAGLREHFSTASSIVIHAVGLAALGLHVYQGADRLLSRGLGSGRATVLGFLAAAVVFVAYADVLAWFAIGRTFLPR